MTKKQLLNLFKTNIFQIQLQFSNFSSSVISSFSSSKNSGENNISIKENDIFSITLNVITLFKATQKN